MKDLIVAVALTLLVQAMISMTVVAPAVLAPVAQADVGVAARSIGIFAAVIYAAAALSAPLGGSLVARHGAVRVSQYCLLLAGSGFALCVLARPLVLVAGALLIGCGYGPITPASSEILVARTPERMRNLVMSIRQSGVPVGGALAGVVVPILLLFSGACLLVLRRSQQKIRINVAAFIRVRDCGYPRHHASFVRHSRLPYLRSSGIRRDR